MCLRFLTNYAESHYWPEISELTASRIEEYLVYIQERPRWFGKSDQGPVSASSVETHYRRIKTFFNWLVERGYLATNPLNLIQHPRIEERVIPTVSDHQILDLLELLDPRHARTPAERFRALRNRAIIWLLVDTPIRRGELAGLSVDDVDLDAGIIKVMGKGRRERLMPLGETSLLAFWISIPIGSAIHLLLATCVAVGLNATYALSEVGSESPIHTSAPSMPKTLPAPIGNYHQVTG